MLRSTVPKGPVRNHTVHYTAAYKFSEAPEDYIGVDMTYHVTVQ